MSVVLECWDDGFAWLDAWISGSDTAESILDIHVRQRFGEEEEKIPPTGNTRHSCMGVIQEYQYSIP